MVEQKFNELLVEFWKKCCDHSLKLGNEYFEASRVVDMQVEEITGNDSDNQAKV